uniref:Uncharacterized protein n=1 Tax=Timema poppense TaxID=170557 RepID=A0A7R9CN84_TIMPO|nr:unnamed protein product [Timema poppensis]
MVRYLGVTLDEKRSFLAHMDNWVWAQQLRGDRVKRKLRALQREILIRLSGAYKTIPTNSLYFTLDVWPLDLEVRKRATGYWRRKGKLDKGRLEYRLGEKEGKWIQMRRWKISLSEKPCSLGNKREAGLELSSTPGCRLATVARLPEGTGAVDQARKSGPRGHRNRDCGLPGQSVMFKYMSFALKGSRPILAGYTKVQLLRKAHAVTGQNQTINDSRCFLIRTIQLSSAARNADSLLFPWNKTLFMYKEFGVN